LLNVRSKLWTHQQQMLEFLVDRLEENGYAWLIAGCAVGKTLTIYKLIEMLGVKRVLILTTKSAIGSAWANDAKKHADEYHVTLLTENVRVITPTSDEVVAKNVLVKDKALHTKGDGVFVINYESAWRIQSSLQDFDLIVADESHKLGNPKSKQSSILSSLPAKYKVAMTGTAWNNKPLDAYGQVNFLSGERVLGKWYSFYYRHCILKRVENFDMIVGYKNLEDLTERVNPFTMLVETEKVLDLPPVRHIERSIPMPKGFAKFYTEFEDEMLAEYGDDLLIANNKLIHALRLHQLTSGYFISKENKHVEVLSPKLDELMNVLDEIGGEPVVVFTRFRHDVELISKALVKAKITYKVLVGGKHEHEEWQAGDGQVLIANLSAGSAGVNLDRARYAIYYSLGHSRTDYDQSLYRIRRDGSDRSKFIVYYHLIMENTVDEEIRTAMKGKGQVSDYLLKRIENKLLDKRK